MNDPWKYVAFPLAAIFGYLASMGLTETVASAASLSEPIARFAVIGGTGLVAGFMLDEVIPAYLEKVREEGFGSSSGGGDFGGGDMGGGDEDFGGGDMDFGE